MHALSMTKTTVIALDQSIWYDFTFNHQIGFVSLGKGYKTLLGAEARFAPWTGVGRIISLLDRVETTVTDRRRHCSECEAYCVWPCDNRRYLRGADRLTTLTTVTEVDRRVETTCYSDNRPPPHRLRPLLIMCRYPWFPLSSGTKIVRPTDYIVLEHFGRARRQHDVVAVSAGIAC